MKKVLKRSLSLLLAITIVFSTAYVGINENSIGRGFGVEAKAATVSGETVKKHVEGYVGGSWASGMCLDFVATMFQQLGGTRTSSCCAINYAKSYRVSSSQDNIPIGADVYFNNTTNYTCSCGSRCGHIGIYVGDGYMVHASGGIVRKDKLSYVSNYYGWGYHGGISLNNYTEPPSYSFLSTNKTEYNINEEVIFTCNTDATPNCNVVWVYHPDGESSYYENVGTNLLVSFSKTGKYKAEVYAWNDYGNTKSESVYFTVGNPAYSYLSTNKTEYNINEEVIFTCNTDATPNCNVVWVYHPDGESSYYENIGTTVSVAFSKPGKYQAEVYAWNSIGNTKSEAISFTVGSPTFSYLSTNKTEYNINEEVVFTCNTDATPNCNVVWVYHPDGESSYYENVGTTLSVGFSKPGKYKAEVHAWNGIGSTKSEVIEFWVVKKIANETPGTDIDYANLIIRTTVENCSDITDILDLSDTADVTVHASQNNDIYGTGTVIIVYEGDTQVGVFDLIVNGDTNGDSVCDALDAAQVALATNGQKNMTGLSKMAADSNLDDVVDIEDYQAIVNQVVA